MRALPRGRLGVLPAGRTRRQRRIRPHPGRAAQPQGLDGRARPRPARRGAHRAGRRGAGLLPLPRRAMGSHPQASRRRRSGRGRDPCGARRQAVPLAARSRDRYGPHARNVRPGARTRAQGFDLSHDMLALARSRLARAGLPHCSVRQGDIFDLALPKIRSTSSSFIRCCTSSTTALASCLRGCREGAAAGRPPAGGRFRAARSGVSPRGARPSAPRIFRRGRVRSG